MLTLTTERKTIGAASLANLCKFFAPTSQQLMDVGLVAYIPHKLVLRGGEHLVHGNGELDHAKVWPQVAAGLGKLGD